MWDQRPPSHWVIIGGGECAVLGDTAGDRGVEDLQGQLDLVQIGPGDVDHHLGRRGAQVATGGTEAVACIRWRRCGRVATEPGRTMIMSSCESYTSVPPATMPPRNPRAVGEHTRSRGSAVRRTRRARSPPQGRRGSARARSGLPRKLEIAGRERRRARISAPRPASAARRREDHRAVTYL